MFEESNSEGLSESEMWELLGKRVQSILIELMGDKPMSAEHVTALHQRTQLAVQSLIRILQNIPTPQEGETVNHATERYSKACSDVLTDLSLDDAMTVCTFLEGVRVSLARSLARKTAVDRMLRQLN